MKRKEALCVFGMDEKEVRAQLLSCASDESSKKVLVLEEENLPTLAWQHLLFDLSLFLPPSLSKEERQRGQELFEKLKFWQIGAEALLTDVKDQGKKVVSNMMANLPFLEGAFKASAFEKRYQGVPALICGAGPSLQRHLPLLQEASQRALLFTGGTAIKAVREAGTIPHFAAALDPNPPLHLFSGEMTQGIPFFFPLRLAKEILSEVRGPKIWAADGISYPLENWLTEQLGLEEPSIEGGWNVATFCISLSAMMGCDPIILVGVDLSLPDGRSYAAGIDHSYSTDSLIESPQGVTKADFILAADWISAFKEKFPSIRMINAAKEAWPIQGVEHVSLDSLLRELPSHGISSIPNDSLGQPIALSQRAVKETLHALKKSLQVAAGHCSSLIELLESYFPSDPRQSGHYILKEVELEEEPATKFLLEPIWTVWKHLFEDVEEDLLHEPYPGFRKTVQRWLFWKKTLEEIEDAAL
jgi:hypothetical protein